MLEKSDNRTAIEKANDLFLETVGGKTESWYFSKKQFIIYKGGW
jgi:hypothetical protein